MTRSKPLLRGLFVVLLLAGLLAGAFAPRLMSARAESDLSSPNGCADPIIAQWTFTNDSTSPSTGTGTFAQGIGITGPQFFSGEIPSENPAISFAGWNTADLDTTAYLELRVDTTDRTAISINFKSRVSNTGPTSFAIYYSIDGNEFNSFGSPSTLTNDEAWHLVSFDLSTISGLDNNPNAVFRFYAYSASSSSGTWRLDNITFVENCPIIISEVAWAGTAANTDHEWIELYNPGSQAISLSGWKFNAADGTPNIALNGTIPAMGYFLLERDEDAVSDIVADQLYSDNTLSNSGESLMLYDNNDVLIDTANANEGSWPAGDLSTHASMERIGLLPDSDSSWFTNNGVLKNGKDANGNPILGTPKSGNSPTPTPTPVPPTATFTLTPTFTSTPAASRDVLINEVAWMGTLASSSDEWIELYNPGSQDINFSGWKLYASDGSPTINLTGTILAGGYFVLASSSSVFDDLTPQQTFSGSLNNAGEILRLIDSTGALIDTANSDGGSWPAGVASPTYASMERRGVTADVLTSWSTYADTNPSNIVHDHDGNIVKGTPGKANWGPTVTLTPSPVPTATEKVRPPTPIPPTPFAHVVINEFLPRAGFDWNNDGVVDVNDEFIEIENLGPINVNLIGWRLSDDPNIGGKTFMLPGQTLQPGQRAVFYGSTTHILLMDSGDTIRLTNPYGVIVDARGYGVVKYPDQSHCRIPDGNGYWQLACFPTPGNENVLTGVVPASPPAKIGQPTPCLLPDTAPLEFRLAVCNPFGADVWDRKYWDDAAGQNQFVIPDPFGKGEIVVE